MAVNFVRRYTKTETWPVASGVQAGTAVISIGNQPGVTVTARGDSTVTKSLVGQVTSITFKNGGLSNLSTEATVAIDGSIAYPVTGASASTPKNTLVYYVVADGTLTLTSASNVKFGKVASFLGKATAASTVVTIGAF